MQNKKLTLKTTLVATFLLLISLSCKKEGCINENASNYDSEAKKDDGSCKYNAKISFWFDEETSDDFIGTELRIALNESVVGTIDVTDWKTGPDCDGDNSTFTINLAGDANESFTYSISNNYGMHLFDGTVSLDPNDCKSVKLED